MGSSAADGRPTARKGKAKRQDAVMAEAEGQPEGGPLEGGRAVSKGRKKRNDEALDGETPHDENIATPPAANGQQNAPKRRWKVTAPEERAEASPAGRGTMKKSVGGMTEDAAAPRAAEGHGKKNRTRKATALDDASANPAESGQTSTSVGGIAECADGSPVADEQGQMRKKKKNIAPPEKQAKVLTAARGQKNANIKGLAKNTAASPTAGAQGKTRRRHRTAAPEEQCDDENIEGETATDAPILAVAVEQGKKKRKTKADEAPTADVDATAAQAVGKGHKTNKIRDDGHDRQDSDLDGEPLDEPLENDGADGRKEISKKNVAGKKCRKGKGGKKVNTIKSSNMPALAYEPVTPAKRPGQSKRVTPEKVPSMKLQPDLAQLAKSSSMQVHPASLQSLPSLPSFSLQAGLLVCGEQTRARMSEEDYVAFLQEKYDNMFDGRKIYKMPVVAIINSEDDASCC